jgi:hypothetical protein
MYVFRRTLRFAGKPGDDPNRPLACMPSSKVPAHIIEASRGAGRRPSKTPKSNSSSVPSSSNAPKAVTKKAAKQTAAQRSIDEAMAGSDATRLEAVLQEGLDAGLPDTVLEKGLVRVAELVEQEQLRIAAEKKHANIKQAPLPRGGTLVQIRLGEDHSDLPEREGLEKYNGRMGRVIEMVGKVVASDGVTEMATILLAPLNSDYDRSTGTWLQVPTNDVRVT